MAAVPVNSLAFFSNSWSCWQVLGLTVPPKDPSDPRRQLKRWRYILWSMLVNLVGTCSFPVHLCFGIARSTTKTELFESVTITSTSIGAALKFAIIAIKMKQIRKMEAVIHELDARVTHDEELTCYRGRISRTINQIQRLYQVVYVTVCVSAVVTLVFSEELRLFYPGWFPFNWRQSWWHYAVAISYQFTALFFQVMQCYVDDSFPTKALFVLSAHIEFLYMRVARIGHSDGSEGTGSRKTSPEEQENDLDQCILDQIKLYELYDIIHDIIAWPTFVQIFTSIINNTLGSVALMFFVTDTFARVYYVLYILGMVLQIFPTCYYVSDIVLRFEQLHYAAFSSDWIPQSKRFKRHMMIFTERSMRKTTMLAGGLILINVDTFFATVKAAYSLFAVIMTMK